MLKVFILWIFYWINFLGLDFVFLFVKELCNYLIEIKIICKMVC